MGRRITLLHASSPIEEYNAKRNKIKDMHFWSVVEDAECDEFKLLPYGCEISCDIEFCSNYKLAKSSKEYMAKLKGNFNPSSFPLISETAITELVNYLQQFCNEYTPFIINDDTNGGHEVYVIRAQSDHKKNVTVVLELMNFDAGLETERVELHYPFSGTDVDDASDEDESNEDASDEDESDEDASDEDASDEDESNEDASDEDASDESDKDATSEDDESEEDEISRLEKDVAKLKRDNAKLHSRLAKIEAKCMNDD